MLSRQETKVGRRIPLSKTNWVVSPDGHQRTATGRKCLHLVLHFRGFAFVSDFFELGLAQRACIRNIRP